ncbi:methylated-DNA--[protein]-cysteine S-methyltransferase [Comamonas phosphati]|nr:methylated-DNA--[protein]-cysteine S-methyltransferase [Comamonas phosphati]
MPNPSIFPACGHAVFVTRIGVCALAWRDARIAAVQLPEGSAETTRARLLRGMRQRWPELAAAQWVAVTHARALPPTALQAVAGVQVLLAGQGHELAPEQAGVLPDLRQAFQRADGEGGDALPVLGEIELDWHGVSDFHRQVYAFARGIAPGRTATYGEVARALGDAGLARAVGQALGANPFAPIVPCHRVLAAGGQPGGFSGGQGPLTKLRMLELEGGAWGGTRSLFESL